MRISDMLSDKTMQDLFPYDLDYSPVDRAGAVVQARTTAYLQQATVNAAANLCAFFVVLVCALGRVPAHILLPWSLVMGGLSFILGWWLWCRPKGQTHRDLTTTLAEQLLSYAWIWSAAQGAAWGVTCVFLPYLNAEQQIVIYVIAIGLCIAAAASMAASPRAAHAFMLGVSLPYITALLMWPSESHLLLAVMAVVLLVGMTLTTRLAYNALIEGIHAQFSARAVAQVLDCAEQQWRELSETAEAFALYDSYHRLQLWNDAYARLLDLNPKKLERFMAWTHVWQLADYRRLPEASVLSVDQTLAPRLWTEEITLGSKSYRSTVRRLANGHVAVSHVDITALKARETELLALHTMLEEAKTSAEQASSAKSRFLANMSHELRTPLNAVIGFSDLMLHQMHKDANGSPVHLNYVQTIFDSGHHLLSIVEDMLDLARIEAGKMKFVETETDLVALLQATADLAVGRHIQSRFNIVMTLPTTPVIMRIDAQLTRQALINLIGNALKFTRTSTAGAGKVYVSLDCSPGQDVAITVRDEGIGIPEHLIGEVLKPFAQVEGSEARRFGGVGLGLPLAKQFIELQGGALVLESKQGEGTVARMTLPLSRLVHIGPPAEPEGQAHEMDASSNAALPVGVPAEGVEARSGDMVATARSPQRAA